MQFPRSVKIGGNEVAVVLVANGEMLEDGRYGLYRAGSQRIEIASEIGVGMRYQTLLHEVLHAIAFERAVDLKEREVDQLANGLFAFLIDNGLV